LCCTVVCCGVVCCSVSCSVFVGVDGVRSFQCDNCFEVRRRRGFACHSAEHFAGESRVRRSAASAAADYHGVCRLRIGSDVVASLRARIRYCLPLHRARYGHARTRPFLSAPPLRTRLTVNLSASLSSRSPPSQRCSCGRCVRVPARRRPLHSAPALPMGSTTIAPVTPVMPVAVSAARRPAGRATQTPPVIPAATPAATHAVTRAAIPLATLQAQQPLRRPQWALRPSPDQLRNGRECRRRPHRRPLPPRPSLQRTCPLL
jgi:hypothetical protein